MADTALTTIDNPYSPFSQFDEWYNYDLEKGYDCCGYIDRMNDKSNETKLLTESEEDKVIESVIDDIVNTDPTGLYVKVEKLSNKDENGKDFKVVSSNKSANSLNELSNKGALMEE